jgi:hypothetical protein
MSPRLSRRSTVPAGKPAKRPTAPGTTRRERPPLPPGVPRPKLTQRGVGRIIDQSEMSLVDVIDNLLYRGVVLNAELILALANVDLVYLRLSALLCAADRVGIPNRSPIRDSGSGIWDSRSGIAPPPLVAPRARATSYGEAPPKRADSGRAAAGD